MKKILYLSSIPFFVSGAVVLLSDIATWVIYIYLLYFAIWMAYWILMSTNRKRKLTRKSVVICIFLVLVSLPVQAFLIGAYLFLFRLDMYG